MYNQDKLVLSILTYSQKSETPSVDLFWHQLELKRILVSCADQWAISFVVGKLIAVVIFLSMNEGLISKEVDWS